MPNNKFKDIHSQLSNTLFNPCPIKNQGSFQGYAKPGQLMQLTLKENDSDALPFSYFCQNINRLGKEFYDEPFQAHGLFTFIIKFDRPDFVFVGLSHSIVGHT